MGMPLARPVPVTRMNPRTRFGPTGSSRSMTILKSGLASPISVKKRRIPSGPSYAPPISATGVTSWTSSVQQARYPSISRRLMAPTARSTTSTFSCDIARAVSRGEAARRGCLVADFDLELGHLRWTRETGVAQVAQARQQGLVAEGVPAFLRVPDSDDDPAGRTGPGVVVRLTSRQPHGQTHTPHCGVVLLPRTALEFIDGHVRHRFSSRRHCRQADSAQKPAAYSEAIHGRTRGVMEGRGQGGAWAMNEETATQAWGGDPFAALRDRRVANRARLVDEP